MSTETTFSGTYSVRILGSGPGDNILEGNVPTVDGETPPLATETDHDNFAKAYADFVKTYFNEGAVHLSKDSVTTTTVNDPDFYVTGS